MVLYINKRDGKRVVFDPRKIFEAIKKAFLGVQSSIDDNHIQEIADLVIADLESKYGDSREPSVEHTQDIVENILLRTGYIEVAKG